MPDCARLASLDAVFGADVRVRERVGGTRTLAQPGRLYLPRLGRLLVALAEGTGRLVSTGSLGCGGRARRYIIDLMGVYLSQEVGVVWVVVLGCT